MQLLARDRQILVLLARFGQLTAKQLRALCFPSQSSENSSRKVLDRLRKWGYITRIEFRIVGGAGGGSGQYVYTLTAEGLRITHGGGRQRRRSVDFHGLAVADVFITLVQRFGVDPFGDAYRVEDEAWDAPGGVEVHPDLDVMLGRPAAEPLRLWFEVDMGTESRRQVSDKLRAVCSAIEAAAGSWQGDWPLTVWVAVDESRADELRRMVAGLDPEDRELFAVVATADLAAWLMRSFYNV